METKTNNITDGPFTDRNLEKFDESILLGKSHKGSKSIIYTAGNKKLRSNFEVAELDGLTDEGS